MVVKFCEHTKYYCVVNLIVHELYFSKVVTKERGNQKERTVAAKALGPHEASSRYRLVGVAGEWGV